MLVIDIGTVLELVLECSLPTASIKPEGFDYVIEAESRFELNGLYPITTVFLEGNYLCTALYDCVDGAQPTRLVPSLTSGCHDSLHFVSTTFSKIRGTCLVC